MSRRRTAEPFNIIVQGRHIEVSPADRQYIERKVRRLSRLFDHIQEAQAIVRVERNRQLGRAHVVEVVLRGDGLVLRAEQGSEDTRASVDGVVGKLSKQMEKYRSRLIEKRRIDAARQKRRRVAVAQAALHAPPAPQSGGIVRSKRFAMKPMTPEEAVMQLELLGHDFFVFRSVQTEEVSVVYRRRQGDFGLIEPE